MEKKQYVVTCKRREDLEQFYTLTWRQKVVHFIFLIERYEAIVLVGIHIIGLTAEEAELIK